jgi:hypothetical protein
MKTIAVLLLSCFLLFSCSKKDNSNRGTQGEEKLEALSQEKVIQEIQIPDVSYVFDIDSFKFLNEFPRTIAGIKAMYPDEVFEERTVESKGGGKSMHLGNYAYFLKSPNIQLGYWGDTIEDAILFELDIFTPEYQCETMQVIGMGAEELERVSGKKLTLDKTIAIYTELHEGLIISTKEGIVQSYTILGMQ